MKICVVGDVHFTQHSFVSAMGKKHPLRLENLVDSLNWAEEIASKSMCDMVVYLGDVFDRPNLDEVEITALNEVNWSNIPHFFIVGNHDSGVKSLEYNAVNILKNIKADFNIITEPLALSDPSANGDLVFLPYITEDDRQPLHYYLNNLRVGSNCIVFSHNDLKNVQYGNMLSKKGFDLNEIKACCNLFINGHIHNHFEVQPGLWNLGILTGQNFSEDAFKYDHKIMILDTETGDKEFYTNPYAFNFYKMEVNKESDLKQFQTLKTNAVVSVKVKQEFVDSVKTIFAVNKNIIASKLVVMVDNVEVGSFTQINDVNHIKQFVEFVLNSLGNTDIVNEELNNIVGA